MDREHLINQWRVEKVQAESNNEVLQGSLQRKEKECWKLQKQLRKKDDEYLQLVEEHKKLMEVQRGADQKHNKVLEESKEKLKTQADHFGE